MKILVVRTDRIGDLIVSTPVFKALKDAHPDSHIAAMVSPYTKDILKYNPYVDEIIVYDRKGEHSGLSGIINLSRTIKGKNFEMAITLLSDFRVGLIVFLSRINDRIAPATKIAQIFHNRRVVQRRSRAQRHEADYNLELLKVTGINSKDKETYLKIDDEARFSAAMFLDSEGLTGVWKKGKLAGIHPGCGDSAKNWKPEKYAELADNLIVKHGFSVVLTGSLVEKDLLMQVKGMMKQMTSIYLSDSILNFAALLDRFSVFVSSSTGPMHMAAARKVPTVSLFCPIRVCTSVRWGPIGNRQRILMPDVPQCDKCIFEKCRYYDCMDMITVDSAAEAAADLAGRQ